MMKRPKPGETEEDILRIQQEFLAEKAKNPKLQPAAQIVKSEKAPKKSLFAQSRVRKHTTPAYNSDKNDSSTTKSLILGEIHEKIVGDCMKTNQQHQNSITNIVLGDIVENSFVAPKQSTTVQEKLGRLPLKMPGSKQGQSIFAMSMSAKGQLSTTQGGENEHLSATEPMDCEIAAQDLSAVYGTSSVIVEDAKTATDIHNENMILLSKMKEDEILAERQKLLESIDPTLVALLAKKRKEKLTATQCATVPASAMEMDTSTNDELLSVLSNTNPALPILQQSVAENWINFDVVEKDKLEWMRDIPMQAAKLKPGEKFEARFDWKGVLLPYSTEEVSSTTTTGVTNIQDERELYLHGSEPHRPGYTLQELFRLARSSVMQQRISAFGAIAGILNIYNQGFYDHVLELPIAKIFFLLRFGLDDNTPAMLEVVSKALALLCYNETDETLLDFVYDNPSCYWQPTLQAIRTVPDDDDPTSLENLQKQMQQLQMNADNPRHRAADIKAHVDEEYEEEQSTTSMSDFQLAETDLMDCFMRTNILQRIYFILNTVRADNSTVLSCLKILLRLARSSKEIATQIVNNEALMNCLFDNFLPGLERVATMQRSTTFYNYPQHLCFKLFRVLISHNLGIALKFRNMKLIEKIQSYLFSCDDIRSELIKVQIECLRLLRCMLLLHVDNLIYRKFLPAFRYMLQWHYNHVTYDASTSSHLIRQHAAALLAAISSLTAGSGVIHEMSTMMGDILYDCCCNWFHQATRHDIKEFSQVTLLSTALHTITWYTHHCGTIAAAETARFRNFMEKYLRTFLASNVFLHVVEAVPNTASIVLRQWCDRRHVHPPLPNVGAVIMHRFGPQLIIPQTYPVHLLNAIWRLLALLEGNEELQHMRTLLLDALIQPQILEPLVEYLRRIATKMNLYLATNFYAKAEMQFIFKLLCFKGIAIYFTKAELLQIAYNFICCLTAEQIPEIEQLLERYIFNGDYLDIDEENLKKWRTACLELVYPHYIVVPPTELTLAMPHTQLPILARDWPYFQLKIILQNYIDNVQQKPTVLFSESEVLRMTFTFVTQLECCNSQLQIVTPTEKLMYFMIAFMGPDSQFLDTTMRPLLEQQLRNFYAQCKDHTFKFDDVYEGKCKFENLYALFVDHFQAASYGDELFSSLVMVPLAQKYDNKWRRRLWSDYAAALRFLNCDESLLIGGLQAYLVPIEQNESLVRAYSLALRTNLLRIDTLPFKIAKYHVEQFKENSNIKH